MEQYLSGYEFGFVCYCGQPDVGNSYPDIDNLISNGDTIECKHCGATFEINILEVEDENNE